ncbi:MAG: hypothetical protein KIT16_14655 [Rhodospirillaceae bacterium]|nr:hypothetical protein [Rhodospirillaceae bacterium]
MAAVLHLVDEVPGEKKRPVGVLRLVSERILARDVIRRRVEEEVAAYNADPTPTFAGLVRPAGAEAVRGGYRLERRRKLNPDEQVGVAITAFERRRIVMLFDDRQIERLDEELIVRENSTVTFLRLVPLAGG